ncbi:MAG: copper chaperone Copz family protein [Acidobacteria bacterium]|nr:copper chaperone Copz family protein [Acidobacteriota bacterium]
MDSCCYASKPLSAEEKRICPQCNAKGHPVTRVTVESLLLDPALASADGADYYFCKNPTCPAVYFSNESGKIFWKHDLKVRVGIKETGDPIPLCYCFGHTRASIALEIGRSGRSTVIQRIGAELRARRCFCERSNPSGSCCLGDVSRAVQELFREAMGRSAL